VTADSKEFVRAACVARTVERGKNPGDGTGEGLATLTHPAAVERSWWGDKGHPASLRSREREPTRGESRAQRAAVVCSRERSTRDGARAVGPRFGSEGELNPKRGAPGFGSGSGCTRKTARPGGNGRGGSAGSHEGATRVTPRNSEGVRNLHESQDGYGQPCSPAEGRPRVSGGADDKNRNAPSSAERFRVRPPKRTRLEGPDGRRKSSGRESEGTAPRGAEGVPVTERLPRGEVLVGRKAERHLSRASPVARTHEPVR